MTLQWKTEAEEHNFSQEAIDIKAKKIYYANWRELPGGRFPPHWEATSEEVRNFVRAQAVRVMT